MSKRKPIELESNIKINHIFFVLDRRVLSPFANHYHAWVSIITSVIFQHPNVHLLNQANFVTILSFARSIRVLRSEELLSEIKPIEFDEYQPLGNTALYDAISRAVGLAENSFEKYKNFDNAALFFILTDGKENASEEFVTRKDIRTLVESKKADGRFTFTFMGCQQSLLDEAISIGFPQRNVTLFEKSQHGLENLRVANCSSTQIHFSARRAGQASLNSFYDFPSTSEAGLTPNLFDNEQN